MMMASYLIKVAGLGFIHKNWKTEEPRFCISQATAKTWTTRKAAIGFGSEQLTPRLKIGWELWELDDETLEPVILPRSLFESQRG
jgi:hypothetical protein